MCIFSGKITIDGRDLKTLDPSWLRGRAIGYISQEPVLFASSILENIRYGRPSATDEEVLVHNIYIINRKIFYMYALKNPFNLHRSTSPRTFNSLHMIHGFRYWKQLKLLMPTSS